MFREIGDVKKEAVLLGNLAMSLAKINRNREAEEAMARKAALCKDIDPAAAREAKAWIEVRAAWGRVPALHRLRLVTFVRGVAWHPPDVAA